jgi:hypothetical protein
MDLGGPIPKYNSYPFLQWRILVFYAIPSKRDRYGNRAQRLVEALSGLI